MKYQNIIIFSLITIFIIGFGYYYFPKKDSSADKDNTPKIEAYNISDDSLGISFQIPKDFTRIDTNELKSKNPYFIYGFKPEGADDVACYVSQTKRTGEGDVTAQYLRNGAFSEIKKTYPDAQGLDSKEVNVGDNIIAVIFDAGYKENDKDIIQRELVATTNTRTTFAFCTCPKSVLEMYEDKFNVFFNSFSIK